MVNTRILSVWQLRGVLNAVKTGQSQIWQLMSDSTGVQDSTTRWVGILAQAMASYLAPSGARVVFHQLRGTSEPTLYRLLKPMVLAAGSGVRGVQFNAGTARSRQIAINNQFVRTSDDLEFVCSFDPASATPAALGAILGQPGAGAIAASSPSTRVYYITQETNGDIVLRFWGQGTGSAGTYADGPTYTATWTAAQLSIVPGSPRVLRFTLDVDNGSAGWTALAYSIAQSAYTSDGTSSMVPASQAWGSSIAPTSTSPLATSGVATLNKVAAAYEIGARGNLSNPWFGTVYIVQTFDGIDGALLHSPNIEDFVLATTGTNSVYVGSPTLNIYCGAAAGKDFSWFAGGDGNTLRPGRIMTPGAHLTTISTGHNEASRYNADIKTSFDTWISNVLARSPMTALHMIIQNPEMTLASDGTTSDLTSVLHAQRQRQMGGYASTKGFATSDVLSAFLNDARWNPTNTVLMANSNPAVHPSDPIGYTLEASVVAADFGLVIPVI